MDSFADLPVPLVVGMVAHVHRMWRLEAVRLGDQSAFIAWYHATALGVKDLKQSDMNIWRTAYDNDRKHAVRTASKIPGLSKRAAEGLVQAVEQDLIPKQFWLLLAPHWHNVTETAES